MQLYECWMRTSCAHFLQTNLAVFIQDVQTVGLVPNETVELFTKDDREQLLDRKIAQMRERNEELKRKHQVCYQNVV